VLCPTVPPFIFKSRYFRGIANPVGCKCGPTTDPAELVKLITALNPDNIPGKVVLISRFGAGKVDKKLPEIIKGVQAAGLNVVWQCDPMHGNTYVITPRIVALSVSAFPREAEPPLLDRNVCSPTPPRCCEQVQHRCWHQDSIV
jgi:hypothetical protein